MDNLKLFNERFLTGKRLEGDSPADLFVKQVFENSEKKAELYSCLKNLENNNQLNHKSSLSWGCTVIDNAGKLPDWANRKQMDRGTAFFARHSGIITNLLGLLSLPYCYAAANGAMVLYLSNRMKEDVGNRLVETGEFVWEVMSPDAFESGGKGFSSILKVRLMHAAVRYYTLNSGKWNLEWGVPVNQEDMAGTNLSFSLLVIRGLRKFGIPVSYGEQQAFMHLWNVIGYLLGLHKDLLPHNGKDGFNLEEAIRARQFKPSEQGRALTQSLVRFFSTINTGRQFTATEAEQLMRYLIGDDVADIIGLKTGAFPANKLWLLRTINYFNNFNLKESAFIAYKNGYHQFSKNNYRNNMLTS